MPPEEQIRNRTKRKIAKAAFWAMVGAGLMVIIAGISSDAAAKRIYDIGFCLSAWFGSLGAIVLGYFGVSTWGYRAEVQSPFGGKRTTTASGLDTRSPEPVK